MKYNSYVEADTKNVVAHLEFGLDEMYASSLQAKILVTGMSLINWVARGGLDTQEGLDNDIVSACISIICFIHNNRDYTQISKEKFGQILGATPEELQKQEKI